MATPNKMRSTYPAFNQNALGAYDTARNQRGYYNQRAGIKGLAFQRTAGQPIQYTPPQMLGAAPMERAVGVNPTNVPTLQQRIGSATQQVGRPLTPGEIDTLRPFQTMEMRTDPNSPRYRPGFDGPAMPGQLGYTPGQSTDRMQLLGQQTVQPSVNHYGMTPNGTPQQAPIHPVGQDTQRLATTGADLAAARGGSTPSLPNSPYNQMAVNQSAMLTNAARALGQSDVGKALHYGNPGYVDPANQRAMLGLIQSQAGMQAPGMGVETQMRGPREYGSDMLYGGNDAPVMSRAGLAPSQGYQSTLGPQLATGLESGAARSARLEREFQDRKAAANQRYVDVMNQGYKEGKGYAQGWNPGTQQMERTPSNPSKGRALRLERYRNKKERMSARIQNQADALQARRRGMTIDQYRNAKAIDDMRTQMMQSFAQGIAGGQGQGQGGANNAMAAGMLLGPDAANIVMEQNRIANEKAIAEGRNKTAVDVAGINREGQVEAAKIPYSPEARQYDTEMAGIKNAPILAQTEAQKIAAEQENATRREIAKAEQVTAQEANAIARQRMEQEGRQFESGQAHEKDLMQRKAWEDIAQSPDASPELRDYAGSKLMQMSGGDASGGYVPQMQEAHQEAINYVSNAGEKAAYQRELRAAGNDPQQIEFLGKRYGIPQHIVSKQIKAATGSYPKQPISDYVKFGPFAPAYRGLRWAYQVGRDAMGI